MNIMTKVDGGTHVSPYADKYDNFIGGEFRAPKSGR